MTPQEQDALYAYAEAIADEPAAFTEEPLAFDMESYHTARLTEEERRVAKRFVKIAQRDLNLATETTLALSYAKSADEYDAIIERVVREYDDL